MTNKDLHNITQVIIFGTKDLAQLAHYYLSNDPAYVDMEVAGFTVHKDYIEPFEDYPVVAFEEIENHFPPDKYKLFAPMTGNNMNKDREAVYLEGKKKGYEFISYISSKVTKFDNKIGENCFILEDNTLQPFTTIGNNVVMWSGNHIGHHSAVGDHTFFTSHVVMSGHCNIKPYSWFGVNSTIRDGCEIAEGTLLAMGACLTKSKTEPWSVYMGTPAKKKEGVRSDEVN